MEMGLEPEMGRIGYETTILLFETESILPQDEPVLAYISALGDLFSKNLL